MNVLAIDAALGAFSVAVTSDDETLSAQEVAGAVALEQGLSAVAEALRKSGRNPSQIDRLAVGIGPGSFTGVRVAISYAKSLALGWGKPLAGVNSFDAIEAGVALGAHPVLAVVRGRKGVVSVRYRGGERVMRASGYVNEILNELDALRGQVNVIGDSEDVLAGLAERGWSVQKIDRAIGPTALAVAVVASAREAARSSHEVRADYGELPAAKVPKRS